MKIVMLCDFYDESLEYQENLLAKYYSKHGHRVTIVTSTFASIFDFYADKHNSSAAARTYLHAGSKIVRLPYRYNFLNRLRAFASIEHLLAEEAPDLIFVHNVMLNLPEAVNHVRRHPGCRMIIDFHGDYTNSGKGILSLRILHGLIRKWFLDRARPYVARIFPITPNSARFLNEVYGIPHSEMELLPLGADVDTATEVMRTGEGMELRRLMGIPEDHIVIFTGGKLDPLKKTEALIEAFKTLPQRKLQLIIIGDSSAAHADYKNQLVELSAGHSGIRFTGWLGARDVYRHLAMGDIAVFPASQSILWQQAISMGLPLIVGDRVDLPNGGQDVSYLNGHNNILIIDRSKPMSQAIGEALQSLVSNECLRAQMAKGAHRVAAEMLDWNILISKTLLSDRPHPTDSAYAR